MEIQTDETKYICIADGDLEALVAEILVVVEMLPYEDLPYLRELVDAYDVCNETS